MADFKFQHVNTRDEQTPQRDGTVLKQKRVEFFLGSHGPFVERFTNEEYLGGGVDARVLELRIQLERMEQI